MIQVANSAVPVVRSGGTPFWKHPAFLLAGGLFLLRTLYAPWCELFPEEAYYWNYAQHLDIGYLDHPPMVAWLIWLGTKTFGQGEWGVRIGALLCSLGTSFFTYRLTAVLSRDRRAAWTAAALVQGLPYFFMAGWLMTPDAPLTACWAATLYFLSRVFFARDGRGWLGVSAFLGLGMLSKYTIALLGPATLLFMALDPAARAWFRRAAPYGAGLLAALIFSPVVFWNEQHHWASFAYQSVGRVKVARRFSTPELLASILLVLTPLGVWLAGRVLAGHSPMAEERRRVLFARVYVLVPLSVFVVFSVTHRVKLNWTGPLWLAVVPALAAMLTAAPTAGWVRRSWLATVAILCAGAFALLQYLAAGLPGRRYFEPTEILPVGWKQLAAQVTAQQQELLSRARPDRCSLWGWTATSSPANSRSTVPIRRTRCRRLPVRIYLKATVSCTRSGSLRLWRTGPRCCSWPLMNTKCEPRAWAGTAPRRDRSRNINSRSTAKRCGRITRGWSPAITASVRCAEAGRTSRRVSGLQTPATPLRPAAFERPPATAS